MIPAADSEFDNLTTLLRYFRWERTSQISGRYEVWSEDSTGASEILLPLSRENLDFAPLLNRARRALISRYGRAAEEQLHMIEARKKSVLDSTRWKKNTDEAGIIGWIEGEQLYAAAKNQLIASAKASRETRSYHGAASSHIAKRFLEHSFMGQTDIGSFIITALTPTNERFYLSKGAEDAAAAAVGRRASSVGESVQGRDILETFSRALETVRFGLDEYRSTQRLEPFQDMVEDGVSYEFAKALSESVYGGGSDIEVQREGSDVAQSPVTSEFHFESDEAPVLQKAADSLLQRVEARDVELVGEVTLLSRSSETGHRVIRLNVASGAGIRKARIRLSAGDYVTAVEAHRNEMGLRVSGRLEREGNLFWVYNPHDVEAVPDPDDI